jgi:branched-chain amino acid transport system substrate-binding protein
MTVASGAMSADIKVANLVDFTGRTATVGKPYGQAKVDAVKWINAHGGVNGKKIDMDTFDYSYEVPRAIAQYRKWKQAGVIAIQGWGTGDTEAMVSFIAKDQMPYFSASYSAHLTDPQGKGPRTKKAAPFNFPMGPSYSDGVRALIQWASVDFKAKGGKGKPKFVHMGDNHPYSNAPKDAGESYAAEMGFEVVPAIHYSLKPSGFTAQCLSLKQSGADYAFLANTAGSNISLLKSCATVGVNTQFMANIWGFDENAMKASGTAGNGVVWVMGAAAWTSDVPGMKLVHEIAKAANADTTYQTVHYMRGVCSVFYMKEAMEWADKNGGVNGANIKKGMYQQANWVPKGLEGVCPAGTWTYSDHRGFTDVFIYRATVMADADAGASIARLMADGSIGMEEVHKATLPRKAEWLGL